MKPILHVVLLKRGRIKGINGSIPKPVGRAKSHKTSFIYPNDIITKQTVWNISGMSNPFRVFLNSPN